MDDTIADAFYNEDFKKLEKLTGIKANSLYDFEQKYFKKGGNDEYSPMPLIRPCLRCSKLHDANRTRDNGEDYKKLCRECEEVFNDE